MNNLTWQKEIRSETHSPWDELIVRTHGELDQLRKKLGLPPVLLQGDMERARVLPADKAEELLALFRDGHPIRGAARIAGVSPQTARRYARQVGEAYLCKCGEPSTHQGWCSYRYAMSPSRQAMHGRTVLTDERCQMCKEAGFPDVLAHYKAIPRGMSHDGQAHPALCYDHKNGKVPKFIQKKIDEAEPVEARVDKPEDEPEQDLCDCGKPWKHPGRCLGTKVVEAEGGLGRVVVPASSYEVFDPNLKEIDTVAALKLREEGMSWSEVAGEMGLPQHRVYHACRKLQLPIEVISTQANKVTLERSVTHKETVVVEKNKAAVMLIRRATIILPDIVPETQVLLTPVLARAVWGSLTKEQKFDLMNVEDIFDSFDDDMQMGIIHKIVLIDPDAKREADKLPRP